MSARNGYYLMADGDLAGPFRSVNEAKDASKQIKHTEDFCIRTVITVERVVDGKWVTVQ